jgi:hypothetical protein
MKTQPIPVGTPQALRSMIAFTDENSLDTLGRAGANPFEVPDGMNCALFGWQVGKATADVNCIDAMDLEVASALLPEREHRSACAAAFSTRYCWTRHGGSTLWR